MAAEFVAAVAAMIVKWLAFLALKKIGQFFGVFHEGGVIGKFHDGGKIPFPNIARAHTGLAVDEVPIIAQTGEGILSRRGLRNLGGAGELDSLNSGQGGRQTSGGGQQAPGSVHVEVWYPRITSREDINELSELLGEQIQRQLRFA